MISRCSRDGSTDAAASACSTTVRRSACASPRAPTPAARNAANAASAAQNVDCTFDLVNGATKTITVTYSVGSSVAPDPAVLNTATATAAGAQPALGSDDVAIARNVTLSTIKDFFA